MTAAASERAAALSPGMNLPGWFWSGDGGPSRPGSRYTRDDLARYRSLGIRGVRVPCDLELLAPSSSFPKLDDRLVDLLLDRVRMCLDAGLAVVVDVHNGVPEPAGHGLSHRLQHDPAYRRDFARFWARLAAWLSMLPAERVLLDPVNEPLFVEPEGASAIWTRDVAAALVRAIRDTAPDHTVVLGGPNAARPRDLHCFDPSAVGDGNVLYAVHMYEPYAFTHQGAGWAPAPVAALRGVRYLGEAAVETELDAAVEWAAARGVPLLVTEFGAYRAAPSPDREAWTRDVRNYLERRGIPWMAWTDRAGFGFECDDASIDEGMLGALGLAEQAAAAW